MSIVGRGWYTYQGKRMRVWVNEVGECVAHTALGGKGICLGKPGECATIYTGMTYRRILSLPSDFWPNQYA